MAINFKITPEFDASGALREARKFSNDTSKSLDGIKSSLKNLSTIAAGFAGAFAAGVAIKAFNSLSDAIKGTIDDAIDIQNSFTGLDAISKATGNDIDSIRNVAKNLSEDGLIPLADSAAALKNLLATGIDAGLAEQALLALRDAAAFGRQGQLSLGQAIEGASQGIKNQISNLVDNAGITKNLSILQKEYAASIGKTVGQLTEQEKVYANITGIIKEGAIFQGNYNKLLETFSGALIKAQGQFKFLSSEIGEFIINDKTVIILVNEISKGLKDLREFIRLNKDEIKILVNDGILLLISSLEFTIKFIGYTVEAFLDLEASIADGSSKLFSFISTFQKFVAKKTGLTYLNDLAETNDNIADSLSKTSNQYSKLENKVSSSRTTLEKYINSIKEQTAAYTKTDEASNKSNQQLEKLRVQQKKARDEAGKAILDIGFEVEKELQTEEGLVRKTLNTRLKALEQALKTGAIQQKEYAKLGEEIRLIADRKLSEINNKRLKEELDKQRAANDERIKIEQRYLQRIQNLATGSVLQVVAELQINPNIDIKELTAVASNALSSLFSTFASGANGAIGAISKTLSIIGDSIIPGLGTSLSAISSILGGLDFGSLLRQDESVLREGIKTFLADFSVKVQEFTRAIPYAVEVIIQALPIILNQILDTIPSILEQLPKFADLFIDFVSKNIENITNKVSRIIALAVPAFLEAINAFIPELAGSFSEIALRFLDALINNAPQLITAIIIQIPFLIRALQAQMPYIALTFATALIASLPEIVQKLFEQMIIQLPGLIKVQVGELINGVGDIIKLFRKGLEEFLVTLRDTLKDVVKALVQAGTFIFDKISQAGNFIEQKFKQLTNFFIDAVNGLINSVNKLPGINIGQIPRLAKGGEVPSGFNNDSFLANLSSGELVVDRSTTGLLKQFLNGNGNQSSGGDSRIIQAIQALAQKSSTPIVINIGNKTIVNEVREGIQSGRVLTI